jgi:hypothetical protein
MRAPTVRLQSVGRTPQRGCCRSAASCSGRPPRCWRASGRTPKSRPGPLPPPRALGPAAWRAAAPRRHARHSRARQYALRCSAGSSRQAKGRVLLGARWQRRAGSATRGRTVVVGKVKMVARLKNEKRKGMRMASRQHGSWPKNRPDSGVGPAHKTRQRAGRARTRRGAPCRRPCARRRPGGPARCSG